MVWLIHVANLFYLFAYWVKDIRKLRIITTLATAILIPYYLLLKDPIIEAVCWNVVFIILNLWRLKQESYNERKP